MQIARRYPGPAGSIRALASQVHPVFMLPPVAVSLLGAGMAAEFRGDVALLHASAVFCAVYTAHVKDGYVDFHVREEDDDHPLTVAGCRIGLVVAGAGFAVCLAALWALSGLGTALFTFPLWLLGYFHAPQLDMNPVTATIGYPLGNVLALTGAAYAQVGTVEPVLLALAGVLLLVLTGVKIIDDATDYDYDRSIDKRTVVVALGLDRGLSLGFWLMVVGLVAVVVLAATEPFPPSAVFAAAAFGAVAAVSRRAEPQVATMLLIRGAYLFLALLVVAIWYQPLQQPPAIDIGVLGPYTYIATEILFGSIAFALLWWAGAVRRAVRTIAVLYPIAYLWDWYTLEVGVFAIRLRTGIDLLGIPLEEHLFIVVVSAFVLGVHEARLALRSRPRSRFLSGGSPHDDTGSPGER